MLSESVACALLKCSESGRDLSRDIDITNCEVDEVSESLNTSESTGSVFHNTYNPIKPFTYSVGEPIGLNEGDDVIGVFFDGANELADRLQSTLEGCGAPALQEALGCPCRLVVPEEVELVFEDAGAVDPAVALAKGLEDAFVILGTIRWVLEEKPPKALECASFGTSSVAPLFLSHLVHCGVETFDNVKSVQYELGVRAVVFDGTDECCTHVAAGPLDLLPLVIAEYLVEEFVDGFALLALSDPEHAGAFEVVDNGDVFVPLVVGDLINADGLESPDPVSISNTRDGPMKDIGESRAGNVKEFSSCFLSHQLGVGQHQELEPIGDACIRVRPRDVFLDTTVGRTNDLFGAVEENYSPSTYADVTPFPGLLHDALDFASPSTRGTSASILVRLDEQPEFLQSTLEEIASYFQSFQFEKLSDKLIVGHGYLLGECSPVLFLLQGYL